MLRKLKSRGTDCLHLMLLFAASLLTMTLPVGKQEAVTVFTNRATGEQTDVLVMLKQRSPPTP